MRRGFGLHLAGPEEEIPQGRRTDIIIILVTTIVVMIIAIVLVMIITITIIISSSMSRHYSYYVAQVADYFKITLVEERL